MSALADPDRIANLRLQLRETRRAMKRQGIRVVSCFNGGLTADESRWNTELFRLKTEIAREEAV